ncbi:Maelstrom domain-containing protein [Entamoeba marina]
MTHHQLLDIVLNAFNIQSNPSFYTFMNTCYKRLHCAERCCYHSSIDDMFHCALADAQHTALMLLIILEKSGVDIKQYDPLPQINGKMLTFNGTNEFVFVCNDQTPQKELLELVFAEVHTNDVVFNQIVNTQVFKFKDADTVDIDAQHENELIQKDIKNAISKHPPNVIYVLMDSVRKEILQELQEDHFIVDKQVFLKTYFTKLIGQDRDSTYLLQIAKDSYNRAVIINQHTTKHLNTKQPSCLDKINSFISTIQHIGENTIDGVLERHGQESQPLVNEQ